MKKLWSALKEKFWEIIKTALTKFSAINMVQAVAIATLIVQTWHSTSYISTGLLLIFSSALTLLLKLWQSTKEMVSTGFSADKTLWVMTLIGLVMGFVDTVIVDVSVIDMLGTKGKILVMLYMAVTIFLRTGFTNQSLNSVAKSK